VQITGEAEFNELFIEEARIPDENIVGGEGNGWPVAITTLMHERAGLAFALQVTVQIVMRELQERIREAGAGVIDLDHLLLIARHFGALPEEVACIELEPVDVVGGDGLSDAAAARLPEALALARAVALAPRPGDQPVVAGA
jgi:hypothetical protein